MRVCFSVALVVGGCLESNPDFDGFRESTAGSVASESGSTSEAQSCGPDAFEPNDAMLAPIAPGTYELALEDASAIDRFGVDVTTAQSQLHAEVTPTGIGVCLLGECKLTGDAPTRECPVGTDYVADDGRSGCCGHPAATIELTCPGDMGATIEIVVESEGESDACVPYTLDVSA